MLFQKIKSFAVALCVVAIAGASTPGYAQDNSDQVNSWKQAATAGDPDAAMNLGDTYRQGWGIEKNEDEALKWYQVAAKEGNPQAEFIVGHAYETGKGLKQDYQQALEWYRKAALLGNIPAQNGLGDMYFYGKGIPVDKPTGISWYQKAANQGDPDAEYNLGEAYYTGDGIAKNDKQAVALFKKAVEKGSALANTRLQEIQAVPEETMTSALEHSTQYQMMLVFAVLGLTYFIMKIRKQGAEQYQLKFFLCKQYAILSAGAVFFYITYFFSGTCDPQDLSFCQSGSNVGLWICLLTIGGVAWMNVKLSNIPFGLAYTFAQLVIAYTFITIILIELLGDAQRALRKKKIQQKAKEDGNAVS